MSEQAQVDGHAVVEHTESHGHSTAAWTGVGGVMLGSLVMSLAVIFPSIAWFVIGAVIVVAAAAAGKILSLAGFGAHAAKAGTREGRAKGAHEPGSSRHDSGTS
ncbi:HGxxPAAW family protein [Dermatophilaceae bacterium Soc4.6]